MFDSTHERSSFSGTLIRVPTRISRATRALLPSPHICLVDVHAAIETYRDAKFRETEQRNRAEAARALIVPIAREAFAQAWINRGARPASPVVLANDAGSELVFVVETRRGERLDENASAALKIAIGEEVFDELVVQGRALQFDDELLADPTIRRKLKAAIDAGDFTAAEKTSLVKEVPIYTCRTSIEGALGTIASGGRVSLTAALTALASVVRQYLVRPT